LSQGNSIIARCPIGEWGSISIANRDRPDLGADDCSGRNFMWFPVLLGMARDGERKMTTYRITCRWTADTSDYDDPVSGLAAIIKLASKGLKEFQFVSAEVIPE